jgi:hypothetical protein
MVLLDALRSGEHKQKTLRYGNWENPDAPVCTIGLIMRLFYKDSAGKNSITMSNDLGVPRDTIVTLIELNDGGWTFPNIAIYLEGKFKRYPTPNA